MRTINYNGNSKKTGIYAIRNLTNNKIYIGSTKCAFHNRKTRHLRSLEKNDHYNEHLQSAYNKYGVENFVFEILMFCNPDDCDKWEAIFIEQYKSNLREYGYNIASVTNYKFNYKHTDIHIKEMSIRKKKRAHLKNGLNEEERGINKSVLLYDMNGNFIKRYESCKKLSEETGWQRCTISITLKRRKLYVNKHIIIFENDILTQADISYVNKRYLPKKVYLYDLNMNLIRVLDSAKEASILLKCNISNIRMCCCGLTNKIKGYITKYE